jgi:hypothetical protein
VTDFQTQPDFDALYPVPVVRATAISRMQEQRLGDLCFDQDTGRFLGEENVGVFAGACNKDRLFDRLVSLDESGTGGHWVVVLPTKQITADFYQRWHSIQGAVKRSSKNPETWRSDRLIFAQPESLKSVADGIADFDIPIAGIVVIDPHCMIHKARGFSRGSCRIRNDRPQLIADFRARLSQGLWSPPLMFCAEKPAKSLNTDAMLGPYCLEALRYVDGRYLRMGEPPAEFFDLTASGCSDTVPSRQLA